MANQHDDDDDDSEMCGYPALPMIETAMAMAMIHQISTLIPYHDVNWDLLRTFLTCFALYIIGDCDEALGHDSLCSSSLPSSSVRGRRVVVVVACGRRVRGGGWPRAGVHVGRADVGGDDVQLAE